MKIRTALLCGALLASAAACRNDETESIDQSAQAVERARQFDLASAEADFASRRDVYVGALRGRLNLFESQAAIGRGILADTSLTENDRAQATEKVGVLEREIGEARMAVDALATSTSTQWDSASETCDDAFSQLGTARDEAYDALSADRKIADPVKSGAY
jgi:hypothetical protein